MRSIPDPGFAGDTGTADPGLVSALAAYERAAARSGTVDVSEAHHGVLALLQDTRLLVPVVAMLGEVEYDAPAGGRAESRPARDKTSDMAAVLMTGRDGRTALLAFTGTPALEQWAQSQGGDVRPVPVTARDAARAALRDDASALLVDLAGPVMFVVDRDDLESLAAGLRLTRLDGDRWAWASTGGGFST